MVISAHIPMAHGGSARECRSLVNSLWGVIRLAILEVREQDKECQSDACQALDDAYAKQEAVATEYDATNDSDRQKGNCCERRAFQGPGSTWT